MQQFFKPEDNTTGGNYARDYSLYVEDDPAARKVRMGMTDVDYETSMVELSTNRARGIAKALVDAAELVDGIAQVGDTSLTVSQLSKLPTGTVVRFADLPTSGSRFALKANAPLDIWVVDSGAEWSSTTLESKSSTKIIFIPEETV